MHIYILSCIVNIKEIQRNKKKENYFLSNYSLNRATKLGREIYG